MFIHERTPDPLWVEDLARLAPPSEKVNWLKLIWEPGESYGPVQRWEIREMIARTEFVHPEMIEALKGPSPREDGRWVYGETTMGEWTSYPERQWFSNSIVSLTQWQIFRETGLYSHRFWIIQGDRGGHKWMLSAAEQNFAKSYGIENADTPAPGDLPYADYDQRVFNKIAEIDRLHKWDEQIRWDKRQVRKTDAGLYVMRDRNAEKRQYNEQMMKWLETQIEDTVDDMSPQALARIAADMPPGDRYYNKDEDALERSLIEA